MTNHKAEALRLIEVARNGVSTLTTSDEYGRRSVMLALAMAADATEAIEEKRPRRAKKEAADG